MQSFLDWILFLKSGVERSLAIFGLAGADGGALEVELVRLVVVLVEEDDGLGGEVVDPRNHCSLHELEILPNGGKADACRKV
jgi:hypothetical protein